MEGGWHPDGCSVPGADGGAEDGLNDGGVGSSSNQRTGGSIPGSASSMSMSPLARHLTPKIAPVAVLAVYECELVPMGG